MKVSLVRIGNSRGVILPKPIRLLAGLLSDAAELTVEGNRIILQPPPDRGAHAGTIRKRGTGK
jgi:virulence-associated protein VagC